MNDQAFQIIEVISIVDDDGMVLCTYTRQPDPRFYYVFTPFDLDRASDQPADSATASQE
jgi:hypothetical protein